jgi:hypothetical protein
MIDLHEIRRKQRPFLRAELEKENGQCALACPRSAARPLCHARCCRSASADLLVPVCGTKRDKVGFLCKKTHDGAVCRRFPGP